MFCACDLATAASSWVELIWFDTISLWSQVLEAHQDNCGFWSAAGALVALHHLSEHETRTILFLTASQHYRQKASLWISASLVEERFLSSVENARAGRRPPLSRPNLSKSLCMTFSMFLQPIEVKITVGCERAEWLDISKITVGIHHCHCDTPSGMNLVKWEQCIGQGHLTVTNASPVTTNRSVQIASGL